MSQAAPVNRTLAEAAAEALLNLLGRDCVQRWEVAGSVRRLQPEVHDVEVVVIPRTGATVDPSNLFGAAREVNLLWHRLDELAAAGELAPAVYPGGGRRWGRKMRGLVLQGRPAWEGLRIELYTTTPDAWGLQMLIRTGPAEFSRAMVQRLRRYGYEAREGKVWPQRRGYPMRVPEEHDLFRLVGLWWISPAERTPELVEEPTP